MLRCLLHHSDEVRERALELGLIGLVGKIWTSVVLPPKAARSTRGGSSSELATEVLGMLANFAARSLATKRSFWHARTHARVRMRARNAMQHNATHCAALRCAALHCTGLHWAALHRAAQRSAALYCTTLHRAALHSTALRCAALHCTGLHCAALHSTAQGCTALHCTPLHRAARRCAALHCTMLRCMRLFALSHIARYGSSPNVVGVHSLLHSLVRLAKAVSAAGSIAVHHGVFDVLSSLARAPECRMYFFKVTGHIDPAGRPCRHVERRHG